MAQLAEKIFTRKFETQTESLALSEIQETYIVLFFYPKDNTPGCTIEVQDFNLLLNEFKTANCALVGASRDSKSSHIKFSDKFDLQYPLLSDPDETLCKAFDVIKEKNMFGKIGFGIERSTFILNQKGEILQEWRKVKVPEHAQEVLEAVKAL
ncbi:peroxiredoxin [Ignatzschineria sp. LJL83]